MVPKYAEGDRVRFVGHPDGDDHEDYVQLIGQEGEIVQSDDDLLFIEVRFADFSWTDRQTGTQSNVFLVLNREIKAVK